MLLLPEIAAKLACGWKAVRSEDGVIVVRGEDRFVMSGEDFEIAKRVAERIGTQNIPTNEPSGVIAICSIARKMVAEEVFSGGALRVLYYPALTQASAFYRCILPSLTLAQGERVRAFVSSTRAAREALDYDVVVIQIDHSPSALRFATALKQAGKKVVYELDDAFDRLEPWHPRYELYRREDVRALVYKMMETVDAITVPTAHLAELYKGRAPITIVPNMIDLAGWPKAKPNTTGAFRIMWAGSPSHAGDFACAKKALAAIHRRHPDVRFVFFGFLPDGLEIDPRAVEFHDFVPFEEYPVKYADLAADLVVAPLADLPFNRAKSALRLIEAGASGYPVIASKVGAYATEGEALVPLVTTDEDWVNAIESVILNDRFRALLVENGLTIARRYDTNAPESRRDIENFFVNLAGR